MTTPFDGPRPWVRRATGWSAGASDPGSGPGQQHTGPDVASAGQEPGAGRSESGRPPVPDHGELVRDLRALREKGLIKLRRLSVPALRAAAGAAGFDTGRRTAPTAVEALLRAAVGAMGDEEPGQAARYLFGLVQGTIGRSPTDLRERAAQVYHRSPETFRKDRERLLIDRVAEEILLLCLPDRPTPEGVVPDRDPGPGTSPGAAADAVDRTRARLAADLQHVLLDDGADPQLHRTGSYGPYLLPQDDRAARVFVHLGSAELLHDVDIITTSDNVYLDPSRTYAATLAGRVRAAAAVRDADGAIVDDVVLVELTAWVREHGAPGRPVTPGLVVPTSSGALARRGIRRIYHAAVAEPVPALNGYHVEGATITRAVVHCFERAAAERADHHPPLTSICLPLFGAGRAGLDPATSFSWLWPAVAAELAADPSWDVHLTTWRPAETAIVLRGLYRSLETR